MIDLQFWIPFVGFRDLPRLVVDAVGLDNRKQWSAFVISWLGYNIALGYREKK